MRVLLKANLIISALLWAASAFASTATSNSLTYQGRILKTDGSPLEYSNVGFIFQILDPSGQCVIYQEEVSGINMTNSGGVFDVPIGTGTVAWPGGLSTVIDSFNNSSTYTCGACSGYTCSAGSGTYTPLASDGRVLHVSFYDGNGWKSVTPDTEIRSVPFAGYSLSAQKLGTNTASDFVLKAGVNGGATCGSGNFLTWDSATQTFGCAAVSGASGGTVTDVTASAPLSVTNGTSTPNISMLAASSSQNGYLTSTDWTNFNNKLSTSTSFSGDVSGTSSTTSVDKLKGTALSISSLTSGQFLKYNGTNWVNANIAQSDVSGLSATLSGYMTTSAFNTDVASASCTSSQTMYWNSVSSTFACQSISVTGFTGSLAGDVSGTQGATSVDKIKGVGVDFSTAPTSGQVLKYDGTSWVPAADNDSASSATSSNVANTIVKRDASGNFTAGTITANLTGAASANVLKTGDSMSGNLSFANTKGTVFTDIGSNTATITGPSSAIGTSYVLRLPTAQGSANQALVNDGSGNLSWQSLSTGSVTSVSASAPLSSTGGATPTISIAQASSTTDGYLSSTDWSTFNSKLGTASSFSGDVSGTSSTTSVDKLKGTSLSISSLSSGQYLKYNGTNWVNSSIAAADVTGLATSATTDTTNASNITSGTLPAARLPSGGYDGTYFKNGGNSFGAAATLGTADNNTLSFLTNGSNRMKIDGSGNVGIGTATPQSRLHVAGTITATNSANDAAVYMTGGNGAYGAIQATNNAGSTTKNLILQQNGGSVGIGTTSPSEALEVNGNIKGTQLCIGTDCRSAWPGSGGGGTVTSITAGTGLTGGTITGSGTIAVDAGTAANQIVQLDASAKLPAVDGSALTNLNAANLAAGTLPSARMPAMTGDVTSSAGSTATTLSKIQGTTLTVSSLSSGNYLKYNGTAWVNVTPSSADLSDASSLIKSSQMPANCAAGQTLTFSSPTGSWTCSNIVVTASNFGSQTQNTFLAAPDGSSGTPTFRTIASTDLPSGTLSGSGTAGYVPYYSAASTLANSAIYQSSGKVGIGTTGPSDKLHIAATDSGTYTTSGSSSAIPFVPGTAPSIKIENLSNTDGAGAYYQFGARNAANQNNVAYIGAVSSSGGYSPNFIFGVRTGATSYAERMRIDSAGNVGIGTTSPGSALDIKGTLRLEGSASGYSALQSPATAGNVTWTLPSADGNNGQILQTNGAGALSWTDPASSVTAAIAPSFMVNRNGVDQSVTSNTWTKILFTNKSTSPAFDTNNNFDNSANSRYLPTIAGKYIISASVYCPDSNSTGYCQVSIYKNGTALYDSFQRGSGATTTVTAVVDMNGTTDYVEAWAVNSGGVTFNGQNIASAGYLTYFTGSLIAPLAGGSVAGTGTANYVPMWSNGTNITNSPIAVSGSNVGIGTTTPSASLEVNGNVKVSGTIVQNSWTDASLQNSWVNYGGGYANAGYMVDTMGFVHLRGLVKSGTSGSTAFVLPAGYRPGYIHEYSVGCGTSPPACTVIVTTTGSVYFETGNANWSSFDGVTFQVGE